MKEHVSLLLVGIGGYGAKYVEHLFSKMEDHAIQIVGAVDPQASRSKFYDVIRDMKIPIYQDMASFYESCTADLAVISSPIHYHCEQTCFALEHGSNVLCEKPAAATVQEVRKMIEYRDRFKKTVAIGFQWVYDPVFLKLKQDILADKLGKPLRLKTVVLLAQGQHLLYKISMGWSNQNERQMDLGQCCKQCRCSFFAQHVLHTR